MSSLVISSRDFDRYSDRGLSPEQFKYRFLAEGDSWMERSSAFSASLPAYLARAMEHGGDDVLIINLAIFGDTMRRIGECLNTDFQSWVRTAFNWKFDAILLSAGGNDFIDAALDPPPGLGILDNLSGKPPPASGRDCILAAAVQDLRTKYLNPNFGLLYATVQASRHANVPIFLNNYDTPVARNAPAFPGGKPWLYTAYVKNGVPAALWPGLTRAIFTDMQAAIADWGLGRSNIHQVPTEGTLTPAGVNTSGESGDWINEIHPNPAGWEKLAQVWRTAIKAGI